MKGKPASWIGEVSEKYHFSTVNASQAGFKWGSEWIPVDCVRLDEPSSCLRVQYSRGTGISKMIAGSKSVPMTVGKPGALENSYQLQGDERINSIVVYKSWQGIFGLKICISMSAIAHAMKHRCPHIAPSATWLPARLHHSRLHIVLISIRILTNIHIPDSHRPEPRKIPWI